MANQGVLTVSCPRCHAPAGQRCRSLAQSWWRRRDEEQAGICHGERRAAANQAHQKIREVA